MFGSKRRIYYGWVIATALGVTETVSWGILFYAFSVFVQPMEAELGWSRAQLSGAFTLALLVSGVSAVPAGQWIDRHGARALMTAGSVAGVLLVLAWAAVDQLWVFYMVMAGIGAAMAATLYDPAFAVLAAWFERYRARALMVVTLMAGLASTIFLPLAAWLVEYQGWRGALVSLAAILAVATVPAHALLLRRRPGDLGLAVDGADTLPRGATTGHAPQHAGASAVAGSLRQLAGHQPFQWLAVAFCLYSVVSAGVSVHLVPYLGEREYTPTLAAAIVGSIGIAQLLGRIAFAPLDGRVPRRWLTAAILAAQPLALLALLAARAAGPAALYLFVLLFGISRGAATLARANLVAVQYGSGRYGAVNGALSLLVTFTSALAPFAVGAGHDLLAAYEPAFWLLAVLGVLAAAAALPADPAQRSDSDDQAISTTSSSRR